MPAGKPSIPSGSRADGSQQRLRFGLGEFRAYRWRKTPGWNPASVLGGLKGKHRKQRECPKCDAVAGEPCWNQAGNPMRSYHTQR